MGRTSSDFSVLGKFPPLKQVLKFWLKNPIGIFRILSNIYNGAFLYGPKYASAHLLKGLHKTFWDTTKTCNFIKKRLQLRCFLVKFAKILKTPFFIEHLRWLLLHFLALKRLWKTLQTLITSLKHCKGDMKNFEHKFFCYNFNGHKRVQ